MKVTVSCQPVQCKTQLSTARGAAAPAGTQKVPTGVRRQVECSSQLECIEGDCTLPASTV
jgi:hypothetical protein